MTDTFLDKPKHEILIVDDSPMGLRLLTQIITLQGYQVKTATNGHEALALAFASLPDLVLLDIMMPVMNGFEVAEKLRADARTRDVPIIFISALDDEDNKVQAFSAGGVDYVSKPLHVNEVVVRVETHLRLRDATRRLRQQLTEREQLIAELDAVNEQLKQEIVERQAAQEARETLFRLMREALAKTEALYRIVRSLITSEDIPDMLEVITQSVAQVLSADRVVTVTLDLEAQCVTFLAKGGPGADAVIDSSFEELMEGLTGWVVNRVQPVISPKEQPDPRESVAARRQRESARCGAVLVVPLYYQGTMMGTMTAINRPDERDFDEHDLAQMSAIAGQLSVTLANARLSNETAYLKEFNEGIVQGVAEAILVTDQDQVVTYANPAAVTLLGYELHELVGQPCGHILPEAPQEAGAREALVASGASATHRYETVVRNRSGHSVPVLASVRPLYQEGTFTGSLTALTDITEIKEAEEQLRRYAADLEARNAELDAFSHTVAHDIRSPLTGIIGFVDLLHGAIAERYDTELLEYVQYLYRNSAKMNNIIDELLLLASVREVDEVNVRPLDMARIVYEAQCRLDYMIDEHDAEVVVPEGWPQVIGYPQWIEEVWVNYLSNAIKYGGRSELGIPPHIELGFDQANGDHAVRFWVRDNGSGLSTDEQRQLFTPFERLHNVRAEGHGLGLSIVRRILEKLGGQVGVESQPGEGSTFYFTLPCA